MDFQSSISSFVPPCFLAFWFSIHPVAVARSIRPTQAESAEGHASDKNAGMAVCGMVCYLANTLRKMLKQGSEAVMAFMGYETIFSGDARCRMKSGLFCFAEAIAREEIEHSHIFERQDALAWQTHCIIHQLSHPYSAMPDILKSSIASLERLCSGSGTIIDVQAM